MVPERPRPNSSQLVPDEVPHPDPSTSSRSSHPKGTSGRDEVERTPGTTTSRADLVRETGRGRSTRA